MEYGWKLDQTQSFGSLSRDFYYADLLIEEIRSENLAEVKRLLDVVKANPNLVVPEQGAAALHLMAGLENEDFGLEVTEIALTRCGGDPNVRSEEGLTPVHVAAMWGRCRVLEMLLAHGGDPSLLDFTLALNAEEYALEQQQWEAYGILVTHSLDGEQTDSLHNFLDDSSEKGSFKPYKCSRKNEHEMESSRRKPMSILERDRIDDDDHDWVNKALELIPLDKQSIRTIKNHRRNTKVYQSPEEAKDHVLSSFGGPRLPQRNSRKHEVQEESELYVCGYAESRHLSKEAATDVRYSPSESSRSAGSEATSTLTARNRVLSQMSRIFMFMLKKRNIYQRIK